jgi:hypothetical protein
MTYKDGDTLKSSKATKVENVGANIWDEQYTIYQNKYIMSGYIPVMPNTQYYINVRPSNGLYAYDKDKNEIAIITYNAGAFTTPDNTRFIVFRLTANYGTEYKNDIMLNKGATPLPYTPYVEPNTLSIPTDVQAIDGYGEGINDTCYNYVDWKKKQFVKRVGKVDMGTLNWTISNGIFVSDEITNIRAGEANKVPNIICSKYEACTMGESAEKTCTISSGNKVWVIDSNYTDTTTFKSAMSGVMLVYELATPEVIDISNMLVGGLKSISPISNVYTDTDKAILDVTYNVDTKAYIDKKIAELAATILNS